MSQKPSEQADLEAQFSQPLPTVYLEEDEFKDSVEDNEAVVPFKAIVRAETRQEERNFEELLPIDHVHESIEIEQFSDDKEKSVEKLSEIAEENGV